MSRGRGRLLEAWAARISRDTGQERCLTNGAPLAMKQSACMESEAVSLVVVTVNMSVVCMCIPHRPP
jgi:hypothetical protein